MRSQEHLPCFCRSLQKTSKALMLWQPSFKRHDVRRKHSLLHTLCFCVDVLNICVYNIMVTGTFFSTDLFQFSDFSPHLNFPLCKQPQKRILEQERANAGWKRRPGSWGGAKQRYCRPNMTAQKNIFLWPEFLNFKTLCGCRRQVNEYPWIASFDFSGVNGQNPGGCAATLVSFYLLHILFSQCYRHS